MADPIEQAVSSVELRALIDHATDSDLTDGGRYFTETCCDLAQCGHGDTGNYLNRADGKLVEFLWNNRRRFLTLLELKAAPKEAARVETVEVELTQSERFVLDWLEREDIGAQVGECKGGALDALVSKGLVSIGAPPPGRPIDYAWAKVTELGRAALN